MDLHGQAVSYPAALALLRGQAYDALENHGRAIRWYRQALKFDPFCYEAFQVSLCCSSCDRCMLHCHSAGIQPGFAAHLVQVTLQHQAPTLLHAQLAVIAASPRTATCWLHSTDQDVLLPWICCYQLDLGQAYMRAQ